MKIKKILMLFTILIFLLTISSMPVLAQANIDYLIVAPQEFEDSLELLIELKELQGFNVDIYLINNETADEIREYILTILPDYILLIGDINNGNLTMPAFIGLDGEVTDLYYGVIDNSYIPTIYVGRLPARNVDQLRKMILTLINYEYKSGIFLSYYIPESDVAHQYVIDTNWYILEDLAENNGVIFSFPDDPIENLIPLINLGQSFIAYTGHGSEYGWIYLHQANLTSVIYTNSIILSFACNTNNFLMIEAFGETWMVQGKAVVFIGSSYETSWESDDYLEIGITESFYSGKDIIAEIFYDGLAYVDDQYSELSTRGQEYYEKYNLFGDPSLKIRVSNKGTIEYGFNNFIPLFIQ